MSGYSNQILDGNGTLIRDTMQSSNFATGVSGWQLTVDGNAEFNGGTFRGAVAVGNPATGEVIIDNNLTTLLAAQYNGFGTVATASIRMLPGNGSYYYRISGYNNGTGELFTAAGFAPPGATLTSQLFQTEFSLFTPGTNIGQTNLLDNTHDSRLLINANFVDIGNGLIGNVQIDNNLTVNGDTLLVGYLNNDKNQVGYGLVTAGSVATTAPGEVAIPAGSWAHEPAATFLNGSLYRITVQYGFGVSAANQTGTVRLRKGSASVAGQILGFTQCHADSSLSFQAAPPLQCYVKNQSGADITTALSLTIARQAGAGSLSLYGDGTMVPLNVAVELLGTAAGTLGALATNIT